MRVSAIWLIAGTAWVLVDATRVSGQDITTTDNARSEQSLTIPEPADGNLLWETIGGAAGYVVGLIPASPFIACYLGSDRGPRGACAEDYPTVYASLVLVPFTITFGIWTGAMLSGGDGGWGWTLLGQALGGLVTVPMTALALACGTDELAGWTTDFCVATRVFDVVLLLSAPIAGGVLAYHGSDRETGRAPLSAALVPTHDGHGAQLVAERTW